MKPNQIHGSPATDDEMAHENALLKKSKSGKATATPLITRSRGGSGETILPLSQVHIPDVFNYGESQFEKNVNEVWHIAHDLKAELFARAQRESIYPAEHAALISVVKAAEHFGRMTATNQFSALQQMAQSDLAKSLANLAAVREEKGAGR